MKIGYFDAVLSDQGQPILATITVYDAGTQTEATIWTDSGGTIEKDNPFQTDSLGRFQFFATAGKYDIQVSGVGISLYKIECVSLTDITKSTELTDMPQTLTGQGLKIPRVNSGAAAYELKFGPGPILDVRDFGAIVNGVTDDATAIHAAIAAATPNQIILVPGDTAIESGLTISAPRRLHIWGTLNLLTDGIAAFTFDSATAIINSEINIARINGLGKTHGQIGVKIKNANFNRFFIWKAENLQSVVQFDQRDSSANLGENLFFFNLWQLTQKAIHFKYTATAAWMEGNQFYGGGIFQSDNGVTIENGCNAGGTAFNGVIDNIEVGGSTDWVNNMAEGQLGCILFTKYLRWTASTFGPSDLRIDPASTRGIVSPGPVSSEYLTSGAAIGSGNLELWGSTPYVDFKDAKATDYDARLKKTTEHFLEFRVGGNGALVTGLIVAPTVIVMLGHNVSWGTAPPTAGTQGDICWKTNAGAGESPGWYCTVTGNPATWKAMANLAA